VNTVVWILAGAALAWLAFSFFDYNRGRGIVVALVIGCVGAYCGGSVIAPLFGHRGAETGELMPFALVVAAATAVALLYLGEVLYRRYGV
jgi:uncharacterized membrane protein YeaQ/YmgE (transglycosylase-associated protein family)